MYAPQKGWYFGKYKDFICEQCYGFIKTGYWYAGGPEEQPHYHEYWGLVWAGRYSIGIGKVRIEDTKGEE